MKTLKKAKEKDRFYLLAGMGGKAYRRKQNAFLAWSFMAGAVVSVGVAAGFYYLNRHH